MRLTLSLHKSRIRSHTRHTKSGRVAFVKEHTDKRTKKQKTGSRAGGSQAGAGGRKLVVRLGDAGAAKAPKDLPAYSSEYFVQAKETYVRAGKRKQDKTIRAEVAREILSHFSSIDHALADLKGLGGSAMTLKNGWKVRSTDLKWAIREVGNTGRHKDVGEKVGGARKDRTRIGKMGEREIEALETDPKQAYHYVNKKNLYDPLPSPEEAKANGMEAGAYYLLKELMAAIPYRPKDRRADRLGYIRLSNTINDLTHSVKTKADVVGFLDEFREKVRDVADYAHRRYSMARFPGSAKTVEQGRAYYEQTIRRLNEEIAGIGKDPYTRDMPEERLKLRRESLEGQAKRVKEKIAILETYKDFAVSQMEYPELSKDIAFVETALMIQSNSRTRNFFTVSYAKKFYRNAARKAEAAGWDQYIAGKDDTAKEGRKKGGYDRDVPDTPFRQGGRAVEFKSAKDLQNLFGFRSVEFGKWIDDESGDYHVSRAGEALMDLADIMGFTPEEITLKGKLAIAFGARGKGKASAHYEPLNRIINLTKYAGGGSLAHEWGHFLDDAIGDTSGMKSGGKIVMASHGRRDIDPAIAGAMKEVMQRIHDGGYREAREVNTTLKFRPDGARPRYMLKTFVTGADTPEAAWGKFKGLYPRTRQSVAMQIGRDLANHYHKPFSAVHTEKVRESDFYRSAKGIGSAYWSRPHELFARAFESYIEDKLKEKKRQNTYLVSGTESGAYLTYDAGGEAVTLEIYPQGEERRAINKAFDNFVKVLSNQQTREKLLKAMMAMMDIPGPFKVGCNYSGISKSRWVQKGLR